jgi:hypothetical protein
MESVDDVVAQNVGIAEYQNCNDSSNETQHEAGQRAKPEIAVFVRTMVSRDIICEF